MRDLIDYVLEHTERGECKCGKCCDRGTASDPANGPHTVDMVFFKVAAKNNPDRNVFVELTHQNRKVTGTMFDFDPLDGAQIGAWIGDQGLAMLYMALGVSLGVFRLFSPETMLGMTGDQALELAGISYLSVQVANAGRIPSEQLMPPDGKHGQTQGV